MAINIGFIPANKHVVGSIKYYVCDTEAELPAAGAEAELAYTKDSDILWISAVSGNWTEIEAGSGWSINMALVGPLNNAGVLPALGLGSSKRVTVRLKSNSRNHDGDNGNNPAFLFIDSLTYLIQILLSFLDPFIKIPSGALIKVTACTDSGGAGTYVSTSFNGYLVDN